MDSFNEMSFPMALAFGSWGGPKFSTNVVEAKNGAEQRNVNWSSPRMVYNAAAAIQSKDDYNIIRNFFYIQQGRAKPFRFKDWSDFEAVGQVLGTADGVQTQFQLIKRYAFGVSEWVRNVKKPVAGTVEVYVDGALVTGGVVVDSATGMVSFDVAPVSGVIISADFEFDVPVRFDVDQLEASFESANTLQVKDIMLVEVLL